MTFSTVFVIGLYSSRRNRSRVGSQDVVQSNTIKMETSGNTLKVLV